MPDHVYQPTLSQLRAFVTVAEYRHFGTAAARLNVSQPTLSQSLAALESGLGLQLIERSTRRVLVTAAGRRVLAEAMATVEAADRFVSTASGTGDQFTGVLRFGLIPTVAPYILPRLLPALHERMPRLSPAVIEDHTGHLIDGLRAGVLDVAVLSLPSEAPGMAEIPLYEEGFVIVVPIDHELAGRTDVMPSELDGQPMLLLDEGNCLRDQILELFRTNRVHPDTVGDTRGSSIATVVQCVAGGLGVTLIPDMAVAVETVRGVATARFREPAPGRTLGLVFRSSSARREDYERLADLMRERRPGA